MLVEVDVQDCFFSGSEVAESNIQQPISTETWENWFQKWLETLQPDISPSQAYELSLRLTNDQEIHTLNAQYRQKDQPTDVLAFAALEVDCPQPDELLQSQPLYIGDIVISVDTAYRQAQQQGYSLTIELAYLAAHGLLHLLGWDHPDEESLVRMLNQQEDLLQIIGLNLQKTSAL